MIDDFPKPLPQWIYYRWDVLDALEAIGAESAWSEAACRKQYVLGRRPSVAVVFMLKEKSQ